MLRKEEWWIHSGQQTSTYLRNTQQGNLQLIRTGLKNQKWWENSSWINSISNDFEINFVKIIFQQCFCHKMTNMNDYG